MKRRRVMPRVGEMRENEEKDELMRRDKMRLTGKVIPRIQE